VLLLLLLLQVFDVTNRPSFEALSSWMAEAAKYAAPSSMVSSSGTVPARLPTHTPRSWDELENRPCLSAFPQHTHAITLVSPHTQAVYVVANKVDLPGRKVTELEGREWAASRGYPYVEVRGEPACGSRRSSPIAVCALHGAPRGSKWTLQWGV
jgi:hypothetical protein